jgi:hypothetical protein
MVPEVLDLTRTVRRIVWMHLVTARILHPPQSNKKAASIRPNLPIVVRVRAGIVPRPDSEGRPWKKSIMWKRHWVLSNSEMSGRDFEETVKQEEARLRIVHPTAEEIPGCMSLLDDFLSCNSTCLAQSSMTRRSHDPNFSSSRHSTQVPVSVWGDV